jgi:peptidoglycan/LPS O-acetylase OafA/YrhL
MVPLYHDVRLPEGFAFVNRLFENGRFAVPFFFVLSGFILTYNYADGTLSLRPRALRDFFVARLARIYPVYLLGLLAFIPFRLVGLNKELGATEIVGRYFTIELVAGTLLVQSWLLVRPVANGVNTPGWSLSVEAALYLLFPFFLPLVARLNRAGVVRLAMACVAIDELIVHVIPRLPAQATLLGVQGPLVYFWHPLTHLPTFVIGMAAARAFLLMPNPSHAVRRGAGLISVVLTAATVCFFGTWTQAGEPPGHAIHLNLAFAALVVTLAFQAGPVARLLSLPMAVLLGEASYSLYILHQPVWAYYQQAYSRVLRLGQSGTAAFNFGFLSLAILVSLLTYRFVERPARRAIRRAIGSRSNVEAAAPETLKGEPM